jgi:hypothetical protein
MHARVVLIAVKIYLLVMLLLSGWSTDAAVIVKFFSGERRGLSQGETMILFAL